jgi:hypothetical protein
LIQFLQMHIVLLPSPLLLLHARLNNCSCATLVPPGEYKVCRRLLDVVTFLYCPCCFCMRRSFQDITLRRVGDWIFFLISI